MKHFNRTVTVLVFIFLYIPMIVLAVASFNTGTDIASFKGFTFRQYANLFRDGTLLTLLRNSVIIALLATLISTIVGTMAAVGIHSMKGRLRSAVMTMTNIPMTNPDIVTGVALALLFAVYRIRSTPFYILDEVEAALDDTNLRRLAAYIDSLRDETQLIMITHQRRTMEMADVLFGVSMQGDGVTKVISQKLDQALKHAE